MLGGGGLGECRWHDAVDGIRLTIGGFCDEDGVGAEDGLEASDGAVGHGAHEAETGAGGVDTGAGSDFGVCT